MTNKEIITIMSLGKKAGLIPKYKRIWEIATGQPWSDCLCGNGFQRLYTLCLNYSNKIKKESND